MAKKTMAQKTMAQKTMAQKMGANKMGANKTSGNISTSSKNFYIARKTTAQTLPLLNEIPATFSEPIKLMA
jgi:hypothetical protein